MADPRVDEEFMFGNVAYGSPGGQGHNGDIRPELVFGDQYPRPLRWKVFPALDADPVDGMKTGIPDSSNELIKKITPADVQPPQTRWSEPPSE